MGRLREMIFFMMLGAAVLTGCAGSKASGLQKDAARESAAPEQQTGESGPQEQTAGQGKEDRAAGDDAAEDQTMEEALPGDTAEEHPNVRPEGMTLEERFAEPEGFLRTEAPEGSFTRFLREYPLKEDGSPVLLYDGSRKGNQQAHAAVFALPIESEDLQQCADSVMRVYAEYFWQSGQQERIAFHFVNGFYAEYTRWRDGGRIQVDGNEVSWVQTAGYDDSYENLKKYLRIVFSYAGTLSMDAESEPVSPDELRVGDVFLKGGSPGHVVMVADLCRNAQGGQAFLLAQGYMPAQEFHVLKNPLHEDDPWYYTNELQFPLRTPEYTFEEGSLRRLSYLGGQ